MLKWQQLAIIYYLHINILLLLLLLLCILISVSACSIIGKMQE